MNDSVRRYTPSMLAQLAKVNVAQVRAWHRRGWLLASDERNRVKYYDFSEVAVARQLATLYRGGLTPASIEKQLKDLKARFPGIERPLAELSIVVEGRQILVRQARGLSEPGGQLRIDFRGLDEEDDAQSGAPSVIASPAMFLRRGQESDEGAPENLAKWAEELQEVGELRAAADMYRAALAAGGPTPRLCFELAELLYRLGELGAARERYSMVIELDENDVEARANLGCVLAELGEKSLGIAALSGAIDCDPQYADAHFHLARLLDETDEPDAATRHWQAFLALAPDSPWAEEAADRLQL